MQSTLSFPPAALGFSQFARFPLVTLDFLAFAVSRRRNRRSSLPDPLRPAR